MDSAHLLAAMLGGLAGGALNSIAGGGTLLTFPLLIWIGLDPRVANATSMLALWPAAVAAAWGYRPNLRERSLPLAGVAIASLLGGAAGSALLIVTPGAAFARLTPFLIWFATLLFTMGELHPRHDARESDPSRGLRRPGLWAAQLAIAVYGGYFGAGVSIVILAALRHAGLRDIHQANGVKNCLGACINLVAAAGFVAWGLVRWPAALSMALGAGIGGYASARFARRLPRRVVRWIVIAVGLVIGAAMFVRTWHAAP